MKRQKNPRGRPPKEPEARRRQLLDSAIAVYLKKGFRSARVEDIVAHAATGKGTFYLHFKDKEAAFEAALEELFAELIETLDWTRSKVSEAESLQEVFRQEAERILGTLTRHRDVSLLLLREGSSVSPRIERKVTQFYWKQIERAQETFASAKKLGLLPTALDERIAAICILGSIEKAYYFWLQGKLEGDPIDTVQGALEFLSRGCGLEL
jgi:AcrR family transcriptional regulator